jgi:peptide/nickel transport system permease protein
MKTLSHLGYLLVENPLTLAAAVLALLLLLGAVLGPSLAPYDPLATNTMRALEPPSWEHWFGTDMETIMAFPLFVLAMGIVAALGNTMQNIIYATAIINLPFYARLARAEINLRREAGFVEAARLSGNTDARILAVHLFPTVLPTMMVQISLNMGWSILNAASLSFIGLGVRPPTPEWGIMVADGASYIISGEWWVALFPGAALMVAVFCSNLLGDGLRDLIDPRQRT